MSFRITASPRHVALNFFLLTVAIVMVFPWLIAISTALKAPGEMNQNLGLIPQRIDLAKFVEVAQIVDLPRLAFNSIVITGVTVVVVLILASLAAFAFARLDFILKDVLFVMLMVGLMLQTAAIMVPLYQVNVALHVLDTHVAMIGPYVALGLPLSVLILRGFFAELPKELEEAARIDGAGPFTTYWRVMLPLTRPALTTVGIFVGLATWNDFLLPMLFTSSADMRTLPLGLLAFVRSDVITMQEHRFAFVVIMTLPVVVLFVALQRQFISGLTAGAVK